MKYSNVIYTLFFCLLVVFVDVPDVKSQDIQIGTAEKPFSFKNSDNSDDKKIEPSAVEFINDKYLLVADDENDEANNSLAVVEILTGKSIKRIQIPSDAVKKNPKWEAMAKDGDGFFYIIGSHAAKIEDGADKLKNRSHLFRFRLTVLTGDPKKIEIDKESVTELDIKDSLTKLNLYTETPTDKKAKIEGLAVRKRNDNKKELIIGLREPFEFVQIYSAELPGRLLGADKLTLKPLFKFDAGKIANNRLKLSSIEYLPNWNGYLLLTSTEDDKNLFYGNALWFVSDEAVKNSQSLPPNSELTLLKPQKIWTFGMKMKAEGLCVLPEANLNSENKTDSYSLAIVFDNDTKKTLILGNLQFVGLTKWLN